MKSMLMWTLILSLFFITSPIFAETGVTPKDPLYADQTFQQETRVNKAWEQVKGNEDIIIAVLDTGVDLNHEDLKANLIPGYNLVDPSKPPQDDNGHGTAATGVLAAVGDNQIGGTGVLWKAKIMPIKVLDSRGHGEAKRVAKGIRLAVEKGARIILMSLGDPIYSEELENAAAYAESKGALLVAATGNDSSRVSYPAAFPTVLSVGAVDRDKKVLSYSNQGPEIDIVAPGFKLHTTGIGNTYTTMSGTSMAAPQVAGIAALVLKQNPLLTPIQIRTLLEATAEDLAQTGWDPSTGFGLVNAEWALQEASQPPVDLFVKNHDISTAASLPVINQIEGSLDESDPADFFQLDVPYTGRVELKSEGGEFNLSLYDSHQQRLITGINWVEAIVPSGKIYAKITPVGEPSSAAYQLTSSFSIQADAQENNDDQKSATVLSAVRDQTIVGNFHKKDDQDWFVVNYPAPGKVELQVTTDTLRMDPVLTVLKDGEKQEMDDGSVTNGQKEFWSGSVSPGRVYYQLKDYYGNVVNGEYRFTIQYDPTPSKYFTDIALHWAKKDIEWLAEKGIISGYADHSFHPDAVVTHAEAAAVLSNVLSLPSAGAGQSPFSDVAKDHWAYSALSALVQKGVLEPEGGGYLHPDKLITRSDLAVMLYKARYGNRIANAQVNGKTAAFSDVGKDDSAYPYIMKMRENGWLAGMPDGRFAPDQTTTRAEFCALIKRIWYEN